MLDKYDPGGKYDTFPVKLAQEWFKNERDPDIENVFRIHLVNAMRVCSKPLEYLQESTVYDKNHPA